MCSADAPITTAGLLITYDSLPWQQRVNHAPAVWQANHKPTVWPNTRRKLSLHKRGNTFINVEVQCPLPIKTLMHSTCIKPGVWQDSVLQLQKLRLIHAIKNAGTGKAQSKCWPLQENICVNSTLQQCAWSAGQGKRPVPLSVCETPCGALMSISALPIQDRSWQVSFSDYGWQKMPDFQNEASIQLKVK